MDRQESFENLKTLPTTSSAINDELALHIKKNRLVDFSGSLKFQLAKIVNHLLYRHFYGW
jgi:hypothetical protein